MCNTWLRIMLGEPHIIDGGLSVNPLHRFKLFVFVTGYNVDYNTVSLND